jgi:Electron transfer DM13
MRAGAVIAGHPVILGTALAAGVAFTVFVLAYFQPQKLFIDDRVSEPPPAAVPTRPGMPPRPALQTLASGRFRGYEHDTSGRAGVLRLADGRRYLRFEHFETSNGPDVRVYLSAARAGGPGDRFDDDYVELGHLKGNIGSQNYAIPRRVRLSDYRSAVVWCKRFSVAFGAAPLISGSGSAVGTGRAAIAGNASASTIPTASHPATM